MSQVWLVRATKMCECSQVPERLRLLGWALRLVQAPTVLSSLLKILCGS